MRTHDRPGRLEGVRPEERLSGALEHTSELLEAVLGKLNRLPDGLRQALSDQLWAESAATTFDRQWTPSAVQIGPIIPQTANPRLVTAILTVTPDAGFLILGRDYIPVPAGSFFMSPIAIPLEVGDNVSLIQGLPPQGSGTQAAGQMFLGVWSKIQPRWSELT